MFKIETYDYSDKNIDDLGISYEYHCVYILENGKDAYIGETNNPIRRVKEHNSDSKDNKNKKYNFNKVHIITGLLAEETPAKHYENLLIKLMKVDQRFNIVNRNDGEKPHYYRKNEFELEFDKLWGKLVENGLAKTKEFELIINSSTYKYSPYTVLTEAQQKTLTSIVNTIDSGETLPHMENYKTRPILIKGDAGTGKTVVATSLFYYLKSNQRYRDKKIGLVYANSSTRSEMQEVFKNTKGLSKKDIISPIAVTKQHYDIIICDEAQRLRRGKNLGKYYVNFKIGNERLELDNNHDELDWILNNSDCQILFFDEKQSTCPSDITCELFIERLKNNKRGIRPIKLDEQMRIGAGSSFVPYIYNLLYQRANEVKSFNDYEFKLFTSFSDMVKLLEEKENDVGLCRLCTGYAWEWKGREDNTSTDISIEGINIKWNSQTSGWLSNQDAKREMGSIYTLPGLDLNYTGVVIGPDLFFDKTNNTISVDRGNFFDSKVKNGATDEELRKYILNTYAVLLTRGIKGTYVYVCDDNLREYFAKYINIHIC
ncbi:hypothetical protein CSC2_06310 [Clostridium zeae]|uniref:GIY-YIG domain-containing protein n=1 Tax=Clostridium zeae TaxID=2759022 RepID=A0ABQ1E5T8_9CLOT|nr:DNA/RNA helicase domain-containing protein [Clostridium zeae]GFZ30105.1 hypothetical protein CSC2_06310 [Clostridium zeae]